MLFPFSSASLGPLDQPHQRVPFFHPWPWASAGGAAMPVCLFFPAPSRTGEAAGDGVTGSLPPGRHQGELQRTVGTGTHSRSQSCSEPVSSFVPGARDSAHLTELHRTRARTLRPKPFLQIPSCLPGRYAQQWIQLRPLVLNGWKRLRVPHGGAGTVSSEALLYRRLPAEASASRRRSARCCVL